MSHLFSVRYEILVVLQQKCWSILVFCQDASTWLIVSVREGFWGARGSFIDPILPFQTSEHWKYRGRDVEEKMCLKTNGGESKGEFFFGPILPFLTSEQGEHRGKCVEEKMCLKTKQWKSKGRGVLILFSLPLHQKTQKKICWRKDLFENYW